MTGVYIYAIVPPAAPSTIAVAGLSAEEPQVRVVHGDAIAAVVGAGPTVDFRSLQRREAVSYLLSYQRVIEAIMQVTPALPVKFGTVLPDEAAVVQALVRGTGVLAPRLAEFAGRVQLELLVTWDLDAVLGEIAGEEAVVHLRQEVARSGAPTGAAWVELGRAVKQSIDRRRDAVRARILAGLGPLTLDLVENALMDDRMIANVALLVPAIGSQAIDDKLEQLDREFAGRLNFRCVGPLPPASFATVEIDLPSFSAIDEARKTLRLGTSARLSEIKSAYHRLVRQTHPDNAASTRADERQTAALTSAYRTLLRYVEALPVTDHVPPAPHGDYRFDRDTVDRAVRIAVRRQELVSSAEVRS